MNKGKIRSMILDMDGVLWRGSEPIGDLRKIFNQIHGLGLSYILATNNSTLTPQQYQNKLFNFCVEINFENILTSSEVAADHLVEQYQKGGPVYIIGENGLTEALEKKGFFHSNEDVIAVVVGMDRKITYEKLSRACLLIRWPFSDRSCAIMRLSERAWPVKSKSHV